MSLKIFYVMADPVPSYSAGSVFSLKNSEALSRYGNSVKLLAERGAPGLPLEEYGIDPSSGLDIIRPFSINRRRGLFRLSWHLPFFLGCLGIIKKERPDAVITRSIKFARFAQRRLKNEGTPLIYEIHNTSFGDPGMKGRSSDEGDLLARMDGIISLTGPLADIIKTGLGEGAPPVSVIPSGCTPRKPPEPKPVNDPTVALYAGELHPHKGVNDFILALASARVPVKGVIIGGPAYLDETRDFAMRQGMGGMIELTGRLSHSEVYKYLSRADIGVAPMRPTFFNRFVISPLKVMEYMSCGLPVVAVRLESVQEILDNKSDGILVSPGDTVDMAEAISSLAEDPRLLEKMSEKAFEKAVSYSWDSRAGKVTDFLKAVISGKESRP